MYYGIFGSWNIYGVEKNSPFIKARNVKIPKDIIQRHKHTLFCITVLKETKGKSGGCQRGYEKEQ